MKALKRRIRRWNRDWRHSRPGPSAVDILQERRRASFGSNRAADRRAGANVDPGRSWQTADGSGDLTLLENLTVLNETMGNIEENTVVVVVRYGK